MIWFVLAFIAAIYAAVIALRIAERRAVMRGFVPSPLGGYVRRFNRRAR